jgi:iron complex transport system substrate-binding protein
MSLPIPDDTVPRSARRANYVADAASFAGAARDGFVKPVAGGHLHGGEQRRSGAVPPLSPRPLRSWPWAIQCRTGSYRSGSSGRAHDHLPADSSSAPSRRYGNTVGWWSRAERPAGIYPGLVRLVSLLPSATEIVYALGLGGDLVGVTFECDEPAVARLEKEIVVGGRDTSGMTPADIDSYVRDQLASGADLYTLHADALARLRPDLILTQDLCRVCALPSGQVTEALGYLGCRADVLSLDPYRLDEVLDTIVAVGERTGATDRAAQVVAGFRARLAGVAARVAGRARPRAAIVEWTDPPFAAGHWIPDLVTAAGGEPVAARPGQRSEPIPWHQIAAAGPDVVIVAPCGYHLAGAVSQAAVATAALPGVPVWAIDADSLVVRPGPRLIDGVEAIAAILHPGAVPAPPDGQIALVHSPPGQ